MSFLKNCSKDDNHKTTQNYDLIGNIFSRGIFVSCHSFISSVHNEKFYLYLLKMK